MEEVWAGLKSKTSSPTVIVWPSEASSSYLLSLVQVWENNLLKA